MAAVFATLRGLGARGPQSRRVVVDADGAMLGPDCVLVRRTSAGYRCISFDEAARIQNVLRHQFETPDWLFWQCCRIARALDEGQLSVAQIYALFIRTEPLDDGQVNQLAALAPVVKASFNPDEPRDAHGRWTHWGDIGSDGSVGGISPSPASGLPVAAVPGNARPTVTELAADNRRQNKMVRDIVVQLQLTPDQQERLHRAISGRGLTYHEILEEAKDMFDK